MQLVTQYARDLKISCSEIFDYTSCRLGGEPVVQARKIRDRLLPKRQAVAQDQLLPKKLVEWLKQRRSISCS